MTSFMICKFVWCDYKIEYWEHDDNNKHLKQQIINKQTFPINKHLNPFTNEHVPLGVCLLV